MATKCPACGAPMENSNCEYCGYKNEKGVDTAYTNVQTQGEPPQPQVVVNNQTVYNTNVTHGISNKSKMVALLLCIFLGAFGIHRFYVGKVGTGILYLCTAGIFCIGWIVDIIMIVVGSFRDQYSLPLKQ